MRRTQNVHGLTTFQNLSAFRQPLTRDIKNMRQGLTEGQSASRSSTTPSPSAFPSARARETSDTTAAVDKIEANIPVSASALVTVAVVLSLRI